MKRMLFSTLAVSMMFALPCGAQAQISAQSFLMESHYAVPGGLAEIATASRDGQVVYYSDSASRAIQVLDISDVKNPVARKSIHTGEAEPTSTALSLDGRFLLAAVRNGDNLDTAAPGDVLVFSLEDPLAPVLQAKIAVGIGPDSLAVTEVNGQIVAVVAIEDEESDENGDATLGGKRPGRVDVITIVDSNPMAAKVASVFFPPEMLASVLGVNYPDDPQPEYVSIHPSQPEVAVSLQENNAVAIINIADPANPSVKNLFCAGIVQRKADLANDGRVDLSEDFSARREPDAVRYISGPNGIYLALANEGDTDVKTFGDGVYSGGRGLSLHSLQGDVLWDSGWELEQQAALAGHYPDARSNKRSLEVEGVTSGIFYGKNLLIGASERGGFLAVYELNASKDGASPHLITLLPTGRNPEGILTVTGRADGKQLIISANEGDGTINIFSVHNGPVAPAAQEPRLISERFNWSALSGFTTDGGNIWAVPDNAVAPSRLWRLNMDTADKGTVLIDQEIIVTKNGEPAAYDLEGICRVANGFWLAVEDEKAQGNTLVFMDDKGAVREEYAIPNELVEKYGNLDKYGFEGVAAADNGKILYVAMQRGFDLKTDRAAILRFDTSSKNWAVAWYPMEKHTADPQKFWMGISEVTMLDDNTLLVLERDKGEGDDAQVKRIYAVDLRTFTDGATLEKRLVSDVLKTQGYLQEKTESMAVLHESIWVVNDNDGAGWSRMINLGRLD